MRAPGPDLAPAAPRGWHPFPDWRRRAGGLLFVLAMHALLGLLFLSLAPPLLQKKVAAMVTFNVPEFADAPEPEQTPEAEQSEAEAEPTPEKPEPVVETPPKPAAEAPPPPPEPSPAPEIPPPVAAPAPPAPNRPVFGPPDLRRNRAPPPDSERVDGTGPNGEPLYAAAWYREPYDDELAGYLSTARGPGWGLIACRTVPSYRVEDCVIVGEYPNGSGIANSVLGAAWQFKVRPPRVGGKERYGEWVRIRIDYEIRSRPKGR
jgi:protein TonB